MKNLYLRLAYQNIFKNRRIYFPYILSSTLLVMMYYIISSLSANKTFLETLGGNVVLQFLGFGVVVIEIFSLIFLFYTNSFMIKSRKKEFGLYNILGLEKRHVIRVMFYEMGMSLLFSLLVGIGVGFLLDKLSFMILLQLMKGGVGFGFSFSVNVVIHTVLVYVIIFLFTFIFDAVQLLRMSAVNLLKSENYGEKEPKAKVLLALLGFLCLGCGYVIATIVQNPIEAVVLFFIAVILVIIGTYLLFTVGVTLILKLLKHKKKYYYQTNHFISVSMLLYRMKKNAIGLANICILSTMVLVMVSSTSALWFFAKSTIHNLYPNDVKIEVRDLVSEESSKADAIVKESIVSNDTSANIYYSFNEIQSAAIIKEDRIDFRGGEDELLSNGGILHAIAQEDYNRFTNENIALAEDEIMIFQSSEIPFRETINLLGQNYHVVRNENHYVEGLPLSNVLSVGEVQVIVKDETILKAIADVSNSRYARVYTFELENKDKIDSVTSTIMHRMMDELSDHSYVSTFNSEEATQSVMGLYAGLFFLGIFLSILFLMATVLIVYYKQIQEGIEDEKRFKIMKKVGLTNRDISKTIHSQVWILFFLPLVVAIVHMAFAYNIIEKLLALAAMHGSFNYFGTFVTSILIFVVFYSIIYLYTSRTYYRMVAYAS